MTTKTFFSTLLFVSIFIFTACNFGNSNQTDESVVINGVRWATSNVDTPGTFAENPESHGGFFTWEEAQDACPQGWRLPTLDELQSLNNAGSKWTARNDVNGRLFGGGRNQLFLPTAGWRDTRGAFNVAGTWGFYWSGVPASATEGWHLHVSSTLSTVNNFNRAWGFSVRCVAK